MPDSVSQWSSYAGELGETDRVIRFVVNSGQRDRNGNLIDLATASLSEFSANPIVTWLHDHHSPPAGRCVAVWLDKGLLWADIEFLPTTEGNFLYRYYSNGWLRGVSAEFYGEWKIARDTRGDFMGIDWVNAQLLAIALVPLPADAGALSVVSSSLAMDGTLAGVLPLPEEVNGNADRAAGLSMPEGYILNLLRRFNFGDVVGGDEDSTN